MFRDPLRSPFFILLVSAICSPNSAIGQQFDAPYYMLLEKNKQKWAAENEQVDARLATLETRFGKKPNIMYILTDDIGYGELGCQGGGAVHLHQI